jgi:hypothetical protein
MSQPLLCRPLAAHGRKIARVFFYELIKIKPEIQVIC